MRLHCGQKCSSTGAPAPQLRHSSIEAERSGIGSGVMGARGLSRGASCAEGAAAAAGLLRVRVVEDEALCEQRRVVVECRSLQKQIALAVDEQLRPVGHGEDFIAQAGLALPPERVAEPRAAAAFHTHTKTAFADALLGHQRLDLLCRGLADLNHVILPGRLRRIRPTYVGAVPRYVGRIPVQRTRRNVYVRAPTGSETFFSSRFFW